MKKTHYSAIVLVALLAVFAGSVAFAQTEASAPNKPGIWTKLFGPKQEKIDDQKARLEEQKIKIEEQRAKLEEQKIKRASTTAKIEDRIQDRENRVAPTTLKLQERAQKIASSTQARVVRLAEKFKTGVSNQIANVNDRLGDALFRLKSTDERIVAHIAKLKSNSIDTSTADTLLIDAQAKLNTATEKVSALKTSLGSMLGTTISTTTKNTIKAKTAEANTYVKSAHEAYIKVVESLKPGRNTVGTSTATTTTP
jgi:DNA repair exonuclease SbcCD ATPase subunit